MFTAESLALDTLDASAIRKLKSIEAFQSVILDWEKGKSSEVIAFSNQSEFFLGSKFRTLGEVITLAKTKLVVRGEGNYNTTESHPKTAQVVAQAWDILRAVQQGKEAQGERFELTSTALRAIVESEF